MYSTLCVPCTVLSVAGTPFADDTDQAPIDTRASDSYPPVHWESQRQRVTSDDARVCPLPDVPSAHQVGGRTPSVAVRSNGELCWHYSRTWLCELHDVCVARTLGTKNK